LIICGTTVGWSINRVILVLIVHGADQFVQSKAVRMISVRMISAQKNRVHELLEYWSEFPGVSQWTSWRNTRIKCSCGYYFYFDLWITYQNDTYYILLDSYGNFTYFPCSLFCQILYCLKVILNMQNNIFVDFTISVQFSRSNFQTVYRIDAYDMPMESCWLCPNFSCRTLFPILYILRVDSKIWDPFFWISPFRTILGFISKPLIGMFQMKLCWNDID
jgi:hypothetical protein